MAEPGWVGRNGAELLPLLARIEKPEHENIKSEIDQAMESFGMSNPWAGWLGQGFLGGKYKDTHTGVSLDAPRASSGARQALVVVTQVAWASAPCVVTIEEPEISLHPEAQVAICRFLAEHAARGTQIIATTHSQFMLLALQEPIRQGVISSDDVAIYHVLRNADASWGDVGSTTAQRLGLAEEGYLEGWVPSFSQVERALAREWAAAVERNEPQPVSKRRRRA